MGVAHSTWWSATTGKVCWKAASASSEDAIRAVEAAKKAFPSWSKVKPREKQKILFKAADILESRLTEYGNIMQMEMGGPASSVHGFILPTAMPHLHLAFVLPATAIATGNTTVLKGSEMTPRCYWALGKKAATECIMGGLANSGQIFIFTPMIIGDINEDMPLWRDENFGPVVAYRIAKSDEEAIEMANDTEYGLSAAVFTQDLRKGFAIAKQLESGMSVRDEPALPMGGVKKSGWGRFNTILGMEEFLVVKSVTWDD
ncbi:hypothetical protein DID88_001179 [Monilinia fructigena]|uniref:Aldehyde dehydrogenase domain-containing protein n=1 Tax=Monilinia fructigena TaxID=38457 RepID=A0A395IXT4_9HELO|nr:hypothetical protein DID88_001179 [Monilinia fructigena]